MVASVRGLLLDNHRVLDCPHIDLFVDNPVVASGLCARTGRHCMGQPKDLGTYRAAQCAVRCRSTSREMKRPRN
eukprot:5214369-Alexandrium_andersonii.AAC.1